MSMKRLLGLALIGLSSLAVGCGSPHVRPDGVEVAIRRDHNHSKYCGHYRYGLSWYYVRGHKHGMHCGHEFVQGYWTINE
jgi:hypothetical protein